MIKRARPQLPLSTGLIAIAVALTACTGKFQAVPTSPPAVRTPEFATLMTKVALAPWRGGNSVRTLENGNGYFPPMLSAIRNARKTITFETFVYKRGRVGREFSVAFAEAARRGVKVHVLLDANGSRWVDKDDIALMKAEGVEFFLFRPLRLFKLARYNYRTHRKIMVVDGTLAYTGGAGYTDVWVGNAQSPYNWRDTQYEIRGPVVRQLQEGFTMNWKEVSGHTLRGPDYFPPLSSAGNQLAHFSIGDPDTRGDTLGSSFLLAINAARKSILIEHAYFIPHRHLVDALMRARQRGVHIEIIICGEHTDFKVCRIAQRPALLELTRAAAEIWEYTPTMMHGKLIVVDDHLSIVGSANFDDRSFFLNDEANLHVLSASFAHDQRQMFERDRKHCKLLTTDDLKFHLYQLPLHLGAQAIKGQL